VSTDSPTEFQIGHPIRCSGLYVLQWEWPRFEVKQPTRWFLARLVRCELIDDGILEALLGPGGKLPTDWRHHPPLEFDVTVDVTPAARGSFGHRGTLHWRLRVDRWVNVQRRGLRHDDINVAR
jgi:hypothetical protein